MILKIKNFVFKNWSIFVEIIIVLWALIGLRKIVFEEFYVSSHLRGASVLIEHTDVALTGMLFYLFSAGLMIYIVRRISNKTNLK